MLRCFWSEHRLSFRLSNERTLEFLTATRNHSHVPLQCSTMPLKFTLSSIKDFYFLLFLFQFGRQESVLPPREPCFGSSTAPTLVAPSSSLRLVMQGCHSPKGRLVQVRLVERYLFDHSRWILSTHRQIFWIHS